MDILELLGFGCRTKLHECRALLRQANSIANAYMKAVRLKVEEIKKLTAQLNARNHDIAEAVATIQEQSHRLQELEANPCSPPKSKLELHYENKYPKRENGYYIARPLPTNKPDNMMRYDIRTFAQFGKDPIIKALVNNYSSYHSVFPYGKLNEGTDDEKAVKCLIWVQDHIIYESDKAQTGYNEYWFFPHETLELRHGDCEDGSILLKNMLLAAGIPDWKARLTSANVRSTGSWAGHCFVNYYSEEHDKWVLLDWCYYPNRKKVADRKPYKEENNYGDVKYSWDSEFVWSKDEHGI